MKVLWLRPSKGENISVRRERIASELRSRGYDIDIVNTSSLDAVGAIREAISGDYDIIAGNVRIGLYIGFPLARLLRTPFLGDVSDPITDIDYLPEPLFWFFQWYEWQVLKRSDAAVFVYESTYRKALERGIEDAHRLPNAVDYDAFADPDSQAVREAGELLEREGVDLRNPVAIYIGVFSPRYEIETMLATAEERSDWEFVFVGEGTLETAVQRAAENSDNVYYPGAFEYRLMPGFLSYAQVGFCFKDAEQPLKLKEYGAAGLPIVARPGELSRFHGDDELIFVKPEPAAIAETLTTLQEDEELRAQYAEASRAIASEWSWETIADGYDDCFTAIASDRADTD